MKRFLRLLSLAAAYLAANPSDANRIAKLHRLREDILKDADSGEEDAAHVAAFLRAAEVATPTADAKAAEEGLAQFLESKDGEQGEPEVPNGARSLPPQNPPVQPPLENPSALPPEGVASADAPKSDSKDGAETEADSGDEGAKKGAKGKAAKA